MIFQKRGGGGGGQKPLRTFPKIHPFWFRYTSLSLYMASLGIYYRVLSLNTSLFQKSEPKSSNCSATGGDQIIHQYSSSVTTTSQKGIVLICGVFVFVFVFLFVKHQWRPNNTPLQPQCNHHFSEMYFFV